MLRYYSEIIGRVVEVDVGEVIEREVRRSYWREQKQKERYNRRVLPLEDGYGFDRDYCSFVDRLILEEQIEVLREVLSELDEKQRSVVQCIYYDEMKLCDTAKLLGMTAPYLSKYHKKLKGVIREKFMKRYRDGMQQNIK